YRLILNNPDRLEESDEGRRYGVTKKLAAAREPDGPEPQHLHFETATQEAAAVAQSIAERVADGAGRYDDVDMLVRTNAATAQVHVRGPPPPVAVRRVPHGGEDPRAAR